MLRDFVGAQERWALERREARKLPLAFGIFVADLARWDWFVNPLTVREDAAALHRSRPNIFLRAGNLALCEPDPRIKNYRPLSRYTFANTPNANATVARIRNWLHEIELAAGQPIGWILAEEFGRIGGRWHCHLLISGVSQLHRDHWQETACCRFGYTRIERFDPARAGTFYLAKSTSKSAGTIHFGGTLRGRDLTRIEQKASVVPAVEHPQIATSAELPKSSFGRGIPRWHR
jgi:hypothetical protein